MAYSDYLGNLHVDGHGDHWIVAFPDGTRCHDFGVYKRAQDAKRELTKARNYERETQALIRMIDRM